MSDIKKVEDIFKNRARGIGGEEVTMNVKIPKNIKDNISRITESIPELDLKQVVKLALISFGLNDDKKIDKLISDFTSKNNLENSLS